MPVWSALNRPETFAALSDEDRLQLANALADELGAGWAARAPVSESDLPTPVLLHHAGTDLEFVAVAGGELQLGISERDYLEWSEIVSDFDPGRLAAQRAAAEPVHRVLVRPFVCSRTLVTHARIDVLSNGMITPSKWGLLPRAAARQFAAWLGFRLPSEVELEWIGRDAGRLHLFAHELLERAQSSLAEGEEEWVDQDDPLESFYRVKFVPSRFGVLELVEQQWAEDDWHPNYIGAPSNSEPWLAGDPRGVYRSDRSIAEAQDENGYVDALAGNRGIERTEARVRLALPLGA